MIKWWFTCKKCNEELHPKNPDGSPNAAEEKWIREHYPHGVEMVLDKPKQEGK